MKRNPRISTRSPKAEFTLAFAVNARDADNLSKKAKIPAGSDVVVIRRFKPAASGRRVVEFALAEPSGSDVGRTFRVFSDQLVPVGSRTAKKFTRFRGRAGFASNPSGPLCPTCKNPFPSSMRGTGATGECSGCGSLVRIN